MTPASRHDPAMVDFADWLLAASNTPGGARRGWARVMDRALSEGGAGPG
jgi:hypothetical protein